MTRDDFACGVVLYHPTAEQLAQVVRYGDIFSRVYIYDNTEGGADLSMLADVTAIEMLASGNNNGLAVAYNAFARAALAAGYAYLVTYDQDSRMDRESICALENYIMEDSANDVAVYGPRVFEPTSMTEAELATYEATELQPIEDVDWLISSGSFIKLALYSDGGFDENLFIDMIDYDYCYTMRERGYRIVQNNAVVMTHTIGAYKNHGARKVRTHGAVRKYYIVRNTLYFRQKHNLEGCAIIYLLDRIRHMLRYDDDKWNKLKYMVRGYSDFKNQRMGKLSD